MKEQSRPQITPAVVAALVAGNLHNAAAAATPGGIEAQEAAGQAWLIASSSLPSQMHDGRAVFESLGFVFGAPVDDLFITATLPPGWQKKATEHSMNSVILDEQGRERVSVFYKAAFYDRRADMQLNVRYRLARYEQVDGRDVLAVRFLDYDGAVVREFGTFTRGDYKAQDELAKLAEEQLKLEFPDWRNPLAYW